MMDPLHRLAELFAQFPGIGGRQSKRFVYFLLRQPKAYVDELITLIGSLESAVATCERCRRFFTRKHADTNICDICSDPGRDTGVLLVVERDADVEAIERSGTYHGRYFVLGGTLPILEKDPPSKIRIKALLRLLSTKDDKTNELILACAMTPEGEHTAEYVRTALADVAEKRGIKITGLGRGLSTGTELEYSDAETLRWALEGRK